MLSENTTHAILHRGMACVVSQESIFYLLIRFFPFCITKPLVLGLTRCPCRL